MSDSSRCEGVDAVELGFNAPAAENYPFNLCTAWKAPADATLWHLKPSVRSQDIRLFSDECLGYVDPDGSAPIPAAATVGGGVGVGVGGVGGGVDACVPCQNLRTNEHLLKVIARSKMDVSDMGPMNYGYLTHSQLKRRSQVGE
jgi:hypothetical protein